MRLSTRNLLCVLAFLLSTFVVSAQILEPLSAVPQEQRDALYKRLDGYVEAYKHRKWVKLYGFISTVGRGGVDVQTFVVAMSSNHGEDFAQYPDLQTFTPSRTRKNGDGHDIVGCAGAVREGEPFRGIAEVHDVFEHENWFFTGWTFRDSSEESCKQLSDPNWQPDRPLGARSIKRFEGGRWRLRRMRGDGRPQSNGYGNSIFFRLQPIDFAWLSKNREKRKSQLKAPTCGMTC